MPADAHAPRPRRRWRIGRIFAALLFLLLLLLGGAYLALPWIAATVARDQLAAAGFAPVSLDIAEIGLDRARIVDLRLGAGPDLTVAEVVLRYRPADLFEGVIEGITVVKPRLSGRLDADGLGIPLLDLLGEDEGDGEMPALPGNGIEIEGAVIDLATPTGAVRASFDGTLAAAEDGGMRFAGPVELAAPQARLAGTISATLSPQSDFQALVNVTEGGTAVGDLLATDARGEILVSGTGGDLRWAGARLRLGAVGAGIRESAPARLLLRYDGTGASLDLALGSPEAVGEAGISGRAGLSVEDLGADPLEIGRAHV